MTCRIDFYLLPDDQMQSMLDYACKLAQQYWQQKRILIKTADKESSQNIDNALWNFDPVSFIPHAISCDNDSEQQAVLISHRDDVKGLFDLQINLADSAANTEQSPHIIEILNQQENRKNAGRQHYKVYRQQQCELQHHELTVNDL